MLLGSKTYVKLLVVGHNVDKLILSADHRLGNKFVSLKVMALTK